MTACVGLSGGGTDGKNGRDGINGTNGAPGKSAYQIWLDAGNTGSEQDFLDSLVANNSNNQTETPTYFTNVGEYIEYITGMGGSAYYDIVENTQNWPAHNGYKHYEYKAHSNGPTISRNLHYIYNEKELSLANYGVSIARIQNEFENDFSPWTREAYVHNREEVGANLYIPQNNSQFYGGTLAYLYGSNNQEEVLLKGNATFKYNPINPELLLVYDNYYTFNIVKQQDQQGNHDDYVVISGNNNTGDSFYNITPGQYVDSYDYAKLEQTKYLQKNNIQETVGTYKIKFGGANNGLTDGATNVFNIIGAFGGTKQ